MRGGGGECGGRRQWSFVHYLSAEPSGVGTHIDEVVGLSYYVFVVFHHDDRVSNVAQFFQYGNEFVGVAAV